MKKAKVLLVKGEEILSNQNKREDRGQQCERISQIRDEKKHRSKSPCSMLFDGFAGQEEGEETLMNLFEFWKSTRAYAAKLEIWSRMHDVFSFFRRTPVY